MKIAAFLFTLIFAVALVAPTICSFYSKKHAAYFITDEENNNSQKSNSGDEKKDTVKLFFASNNTGLLKIKQHIMKYNNIAYLHSPYLGIITPPPDCC